MEHCSRVQVISIKLSTHLSYTHFVTGSNPPHDSTIMHSGGEVVLAFSYTIHGTAVYMV